MACGAGVASTPPFQQTRCGLQLGPLGSRGNPLPTSHLFRSSIVFIVLSAAQIYKSTKCNDMRQTGYCPRGPFCAFAHVESKCVAPHRPMARSPRQAARTPGEGGQELPACPSGSHQAAPVQTPPCLVAGAAVPGDSHQLQAAPPQISPGRAAGPGRTSTSFCGALAAFPCGVGRVSSAGSLPGVGPPGPEAARTQLQLRLARAHGPPPPSLTESLGTANGWGCPAPARSSAASSGPPAHVSGRRPVEGLRERLGTRTGVVSG